ncbi:MAG: hypothetical protein AAF969_15530 [Bacteroidota bacterium]
MQYSYTYLDLLKIIAMFAFQIKMVVGIVLIFVGCFILYAKSKHFPKHLRKIGGIAKVRPNQQRWIAYGLFAIATAILALQYGFFTGLVIFMITVMFALCLTISLLPLNHRYAYILAGLSVLIITIENML